ncbi:hypothetical protein NCS52_01003900 [Fusarium sp. LHS14.1]|nr:hypothetical protein NCS52_01003900 [Fusarium sp. LHS14.1]
MPRPTERPYDSQRLRVLRAALQPIPVINTSGGDIPAHDTHHGGRSSGGNDSREGRSSTGNTRRGGRSSGEANKDQHSDNPHRSHTDQLSRPRDAEGRRRHKLQERGLREVPDGKKSRNLHSESHGIIVHQTKALPATRHLRLVPVFESRVAQARRDAAISASVVNSWDPQAVQAATAPRQIESGSRPATETRQATNVVAESQAGEYLCANCVGVTHNLDRCVNMDESDGVVDGCTLCNDIRHDIDECPKFMAMTAREKAFVLVYDRGCLPPMRTQRGWFGYLLDWLNCPEARDSKGKIILPSTFPWTPEFAKQLCHGPGAVAGLALQQKFDVCQDRTLLPRDPATANFGRVWETYGHDHVSRQDGQSGQSRQPERHG